MPVAFRIMPSSGLVYVRFEGQLLIDEIIEAFESYARNPLADPGQKHLVDLSRVTGITWDYLKLMRLQAIKAGFFCGHGAQTLKVYVCPTDLSLEVSRMILRSWEGVDAVVPLLQRQPDEALSVLGLQQDRFSDLFADHG
ncbi:hypothetical protein KUV62_16520 [Salipiger bermudensis]|uniref:hypothetical protein n=1 Tax=Salipiger bermudensis TaxID=344736 RepID=UPI001C99BB11|nr:hypothetical protein [Salipiger bermudensis]MBY6005530.1 hypothetical protein [Salipiger bermudensis]